MYGAKLIRHRWDIKVNSIDKQCSLCGLIKHWEDTQGRWVFIDRAGTHYDRPKCVYPPNSKTESNLKTFNQK